MPLWGWVVLGIAVVLVALWVALDRRRLSRPEDPALAHPDPADQRSAGARRRIKSIEKDVPDLW